MLLNQKYGSPTIFKEYFSSDFLYLSTLITDANREKERLLQLDKLASIFEGVFEEKIGNS
jgi:hypothetical protein